MEKDPLDEPQDPRSSYDRLRRRHLLPTVRRLLMDLPQRGSLVFPGAPGDRLNYGYFLGVRAVYGELAQCDISG